MYIYTKCAQMCADNQRGGCGMYGENINVSVFDKCTYLNSSCEFEMARDYSEEFVQ